MSKASLEDVDRDFAVSASLTSVEKVALAEWPTAGDLMLVASPIRTLLLQNNLQISANARHIALRIPPAPTDFIRTASPVANMTFANGGECVVWGTKVHGFEFSKGEVIYKPVRLRDARGMKLSEFLDAPVIIVNGIRITRWQVIRYAANKMGASHYDRSRGEHNDRAIDRARASFFFEVGPDNVTQHFDRTMALRVSDSFSAFPRRVDCVLIQLLVTCQLVINAPQVVKLRCALDGRTEDSYPLLPKAPDYPLDWPTKILT